MFQELLGDPELRDLVPFVRMWYEDPSLFIWRDEDGDTHDIMQADGGEQGDALTPALFYLGIDQALKEGARALHEGELAFAFLDDVYLLVRRDRTKEVFDIFSSLVERRAGVKPHLGKTRCWGTGSREPPPGLGDLWQDVWRGSRSPEQAGVVVLGWGRGGSPRHGSASSLRSVAALFVSRGPRPPSSRGRTIGRR